ncbi:nucleotidase (5'-nucleotidase/2'-cyclic phosphodiesterase) of the calcineurin superfamily [Cryptosporidium ryanae]|uniref:nucleotidase (5'-nucleotidase/2'-cyclic phosphodiesterase) of the calcineurin superfamily n=1 Tax=Cryptosporidium ryanae TaxID=515981 RepID=UPI00351A69C2|nr:nucleotidase (5'-nucleotidase/2'-cyclic phosphodiesterase) of the calcineurin superfamily [Cryptosporidium ryanae]
MGDKDPLSPLTHSDSLTSLDDREKSSQVLPNCHSSNKNRLRETYVKFNTMIGDGTPNRIQKCKSIGLTGETFYDYDSPFGPEDDICILHFNDVYNIEEDSEGCGGVSRFVEALKSFHSANPLLLFSGDVFNPSIMSVTTKGRHMVPFLNMMRVHTACFGNHDFDFGIDHLEYLTGSCNFQWILSNVYDLYTGEPLANARTYRLFEWQGRRIGIMGLVEKEWLKTLPTITEEDVIYKDFVEEANRISKLLREKDAELIIALTHMRAHNDELLAMGAEDIDLILGGHDHEYYGVKKIGNTIVAKSGTDFRDLTMIVIKPGLHCLKCPKSEQKLHIDGCKYYNNNLYNELVLSSNSKNNKLTPNNKERGELYLNNFSGGSIISWAYIDVGTFQPNKHVNKMVGKYLRDLQSQMDKVIGESAVKLETRFAIIRVSESNLGNWLTDIMRSAAKTDIALLNSGTIRSDCVFNIGPIKNKDILLMLPMVDNIVKLAVPGNLLLEILENSVSKWPSKEGRFLQVSGIKFQFNGDLEPGNRIVPGSVYVKDIDNSNEYIQLDVNRVYTVATKEFLYTGKDGFDSFTKCELLSNPEDMPPLPTLVRNVFSLAAMANGYRKPHNLSTAKKLKTFLLNPQLTMTGLSKITSKNTNIILKHSDSLSYNQENYSELPDSESNSYSTFMVQVEREGRIIRVGNSPDPVVESGLERVD